MAAILRTTFSNAFCWMKMYTFWSRFHHVHWSLFLRLQLTISQHWFRYRFGASQATSHYLNQWRLDYRRIYASLGLKEFTMGPRNNQVIGEIRCIEDHSHGEAMIRFWLKKKPPLNKTACNKGAQVNNKNKIWLIISLCPQFKLCYIGFRILLNTLPSIAFVGTSEQYKTTQFQE